MAPQPASPQTGQTVNGTMQNAPHHPASVATLTRLAEVVSQADSLDSLVRPLLELLESITGLESTYLTSVDQQAGTQKILYARNTRELAIPEGLEVPWKDTLCKRALEENRRHTDDVPAIWPDADAARSLGITSYASTPVRAGDGSLYGTLCAASATRAALPEGADKVLEIMSGLIAFQVERERLIQELSRANRMLSASALTDDITQLPNRRALLAELRRRLDESSDPPQALLVAYIDLDHFKSINDNHGHDVGDRFLRAIATRLREAARADDMVARVGGDEFAVISSVPEMHVDQARAALRERLRRHARGRFQLGDVLVDYDGPSLDVVRARPGVTDPDALLSQADAAMYEIKRRRRASR